MKVTLCFTAAILATVVSCSPGTPTLDTPTATKREDEVHAKSLCGQPFKFFGVSEAGAEFNRDRIPGTLGRDYSWPSASSADYHIGKGFNTIRIPFLMERITNAGFRGAFDNTYWASLKGAVAYVTSKGAYAVLDPHNHMRYNGSLLSSNIDFRDWWTRFASEFKADDKVIFEVMNSPEGLNAQQIADLNQAAVTGIRDAGATTQLILLEGSAQSYASSWASSGNARAFENIRDPNNNYAIALRQYFDNNGNGTSGANCVSTTVGSDRLQNVTDWLSARNLKGFLVEYAAGPSSMCLNAITAALCTMQRSGVWLGATWWAAGPMWGGYWGSLEPPSGAGISEAMNKGLLQFL